MSRLFSVILMVAASISLAAAQARVSGRVEVKHSEAKSPRNNAEVIVALVPISASPNIPSPPKRFRLAQKDKSFEKHLLAIPAGSVVEFPNFDPIFHNVFSLFEGQRFDLGLYEAGSTRSVKFAKPGVSYIFCNIHPQMEAVVVTLPTPWFVVTGPSGDFTINGVPPGRYRLTLWYERAIPDDLAKVSREVQVYGDLALPSIVIPEMKVVSTPHKNKYGRDYDASSPDSPYKPGE